MKTIEGVAKIVESEILQSAPNDPKPNSSKDRQKFINSHKFIFSQWGVKP